MYAEPTVAAPGEVSAEARRAFRDPAGGLLGGVATGLAEHLGVTVLQVRVAFIIAGALGGLGVVLYAGLWVMLPQAVAADRAEPPRRTARSLDPVEFGPILAAAIFAVGIGVLVVAITGQGQFLPPIVFGVAGLALIWRQADTAQRLRWLDSTTNRSGFRMLFGNAGLGVLIRMIAGVAMIAVAVVLVSVSQGGWPVVRDASLAVVLAFLGLALVAGPWLLRLTRDLGRQREALVRSEERAEVAAHLHDSVLQTLALIQKSAADPHVVAQLARRQERDLRSWLFDASRGQVGAPSLKAGLQQVAAEIEDDYGIAVEVILVGDDLLDPATETDRDSWLRAILGATRESLVNAAKHAGVARVDLFAETTATQIEVFVRDRGVGFDPDAVGEDRHGLRESVRARIERYAGSVAVLSRPGHGTEIRLTLPRQERS